jgi:hypothetical protein
VTRGPQPSKGWYYPPHLQGKNTPRYFPMSSLARSIAQDVYPIHGLLPLTCKAAFADCPTIAMLRHREVSARLMHLPYVWEYLVQ